MLVSVVAAAVLSGGVAVAVAGGTSPDGRLEIVLEADHDSPGYSQDAFIGGDGGFPRLLVRDRKKRRTLGRAPWPGAAGDIEVLLRHRTQTKWRSDSAAVAVNTRDRFYAHCVVLAREPGSTRFVVIPIPTYGELSGRPAPPVEKLRSRARSIAIGWTAARHLVFETWLWGEVEYPLSYRVTLKLSKGRFVVQGREAITDGIPSW